MHFLTGPQASIDAVTQAVGFHYAWDESTKQFSHATGLAIVAFIGVAIVRMNRLSNNSASANSGEAPVRDGAAKDVSEREGAVEIQDA